MNTNAGDVEVTWDNGAGHQPYSNRQPKPADHDAEGRIPESPDEMADQPALGNQFAEGDRHEVSGNNQAQLEEVKGVP